MICIRSSIYFSLFFLIFQYNHVSANSKISKDANERSKREFHKRILTEAEEELANEARSQIVHVMEKNLIRLFAIISHQKDSKGRQDIEDIDEDIVDVTPNPNVLPQVAQLLGAIFSGSLNLTSVLDRTFTFVPNAIRTQFEGVFKLLTGNRGATTTIAPVIVESTKVTEKVKEEPTVPSTLIVEETTPVLDEVVNNTGKQKSRYRVKSKSTTLSPTLEIDDDELLRMEKEVIEEARAYEPFVRNKEPRFFIEALQQLFTRVDFNMTEIVKTVPSLFKGAREAVALLENLGQIDLENIFEEADD